MAITVKSARRRAAIVILGIWGVSLVLPVAIFEKSGYENMPGAGVAVIGLFFGWMILQFGAFANLIVIGVGLALAFGRRAPISLVVIAEALAVWSFTWSDFPSDAGSNFIQHFASGFYVWQLAILLLTIYALTEKHLIARGQFIA